MAKSGQVKLNAVSKAVIPGGRNYKNRVVFQEAGVVVAQGFEKCHRISKEVWIWKLKSVCSVYQFY